MLVWLLAISLRRNQKLSLTEMTAEFNTSRNCTQLATAGRQDSEGKRDEGGQENMTHGHGLLMGWDHRL